MTRIVIHDGPNNRASWEPRGEYGWYIGPAMEQYRCNKAYTPKTRAEIISDIVEFFPKQFNMPQISSTDAKIHAAQDLIYALHNPEP